MAERPVFVREVQEAGVTGMFAGPEDADGPVPAVIAFGGSSGGLGPAAGWAPALAAEGFAVLAVAYFAAPGLPSSLEHIEVEVVERAADWLFDHGRAAGDTVGLMGLSRGSELVLLASTLLPRMGPVVAFSPSGIVWSGLGLGGALEASPWTFRGVDLRYVSMSAAGDAPPAPVPGVPYSLRPHFQRILELPEAWQDAEIAVERASGPVLLVSGEDDAMWPSTPMGELIERRAREHRATHPVTHLRYAGAGHAVGGVPGQPGGVRVDHPLTGETYALGGTVEGNAAARADSWPKVVAFLREHLAAT